MSRSLPPLDLHAHIEIDIPSRTLENLGAVVFAVTRSLKEFESVLYRQDAVTIWGLGCHPGVAEAQQEFNISKFSKLMQNTAYIGEIGLDGSSSVALSRQIEVLLSILTAVATSPRLVSVHSSRATSQVLDTIEQANVHGVVLHWWRGSEPETQRAIGLGCLFSVNQHMNPTGLLKAGVPITSLLPETDHPSGNRRGDAPRQPGHTLDVERSIAVAYGVELPMIREIFWKTLSRHVSVLGVTALLPPVVQNMLRFADSK
ncbi:TatD DNase family protein [Rhodococcus fascians]|uniref:TatD family hydrolase n=1 Tax=Nocardiaceae TaxID=85025 RepID=UPI002862D1F0|nr:MULTISPECIES: TatD family hydrolase [Rhodococcus]MDR6910648.1 TatD DNase family protein [Rhodococcus sp. 3258]MDR6931985.1 TatD DNase family protein [Rhodococcus fascians]